MALSLTHDIIATKLNTRTICQERSRANVVVSVSTNSFSRGTEGLTLRESFDRDEYSRRLEAQMGKSRDSMHPGGSNMVDLVCFSGLFSGME